MKRYNRVMLGEHGMYIKDCLEQNYIGANFIEDIDLNNTPFNQEEVWRQEMITKYLEYHPEKSVQTARNCIGFLWTICFGLKCGDIVLASNGNGGYHVGEIAGDKNIPTLNSLCKNAKTMLPSEGFEFVSPKYNQLDEDGKRVFVEGLDSKAFNYPHWDWVLDQLELKEATPFTDEQLEAIKKTCQNYGSGEGKEHKALKEYILKHPDRLGYSDVVFAETEHILPSGDRLDVYFELSDGEYVAIEVKPSISTDQDITRGIFQCVKYYAGMEALRTIECKDYEIEVILVSAATLSSQNKSLAVELDIEFTDKFKSE